MKILLNDPNLTQKNQRQDSEIIRRVAIPYTGKVSIAIGQAIKRTSDTKICYRLVNKISTMLSNNKQITKDQIGVYKLNCNDCPMIYIGESGRDIHIRAKEHMNDIRLAKPTSSPFSHIQEFPSHHFSPNNIVLLEEERRRFPRKFKESLQILKSSNYNCNKEEGIRISPIWTAPWLKNMKPP